MRTNAPDGGDDETLASRVLKDGDEQAFAELVYAYQDRMVRLASRFAENPEDAEDLAQDIFLRVWEKLDQYNRRRPFRPWLYQVATNVCLNWLEARRARGGSLAPLSLDDIHDLPGHLSTAEAAVGSQEETVVLAALSEMPNTMRVAITLRFLEGFTYQEIASIRGQPVPTVASQVRRGLAALRTRLEKLEIDGS